MTSPVHSLQRARWRKPCPECGTSFCDRDAAMCLPCRRARQPTALPPPNEDEAAEQLAVSFVKDGMLQHSQRPRDYEFRCMLCGRGRFVQLTDYRASVIGQAGLPPCFHCGGRVLVECTDVGELHSVVRALPLRTRSGDNSRASA